MLEKKWQPLPLLFAYYFSKQTKISELDLPMFLKIHVTKPEYSLKDITFMAND